MEFRKSIRDKYQSEVEVNFTDDHWQAFLAHREDRKRRPRRAIWFLFGTGAAILLLSAWWIIKATPELPPAVNQITIENQRPLLNSVKTVNNASSLLASYIPPSPSKTKLSAPKVSTPGPYKNNLAHSNSKKNLVSPPDRPTPQRTSIESPLKLHAQAPISRNNIPAQTHQSNLDIPPVDQSVHQPKNSHIQTEFTERHSNSSKLILPTRSFSIPFTNDVRLKSNLSKIDISQDARWIPKQISLNVYGGLALALQIGTLDEQMHQFGGQVRYNVTDKFRAKLGVEFSAVDFVATEMNPDIGVDFVESPSDLVVFSEAVVESAGINLDIGADYLLWQNRHFNVYAGASYRLSKEILKGIEYEFSGDDDSGSDDDIFISSDKSDRYFEPLNLNLTLGLSYTVKNNGINLSLGRPIQLSKSKVNLLDQVQFNIGINRRF